MAKLRAQLTFRVAEDEYDRLQEIASAERRKMNEVARALLDRGLAAYKRDGQLFEPADGSNGNGETGSGVSTRPETISVRTITVGSKKARKNKTA